MAVAVVDGFEIIHVDDEHGVTDVPAGHPKQFLDPGFGRGFVVQAGVRISLRLLQQRLPLLFLLVDVHDDPDGPQGPPLFVELGGGPDPLPG